MAAYQALRHHFLMQRGWRGRKRHGLRLLCQMARAHILYRASGDVDCWLALVLGWLLRLVQWILFASRLARHIVYRIYIILTYIWRLCLRACLWVTARETLQ